MKLLTNIHQLLVTGPFEKAVSGEAMRQLPFIENAFLLIENDRIYDFGKMDDMHPIAVDEVIDATGQIVMPMWCDSHTHLVYAAGREDEFVDRINGKSYEEIAERGGGILNSVARLRTLDVDTLYKDAAQRLQALIALGTGAIEIKSGYGLSVAAEKKMLEVIARLKQNFEIPIKATLLAAHAIPLEYKENRTGYIQLIVEEMIPAFAKAGLCDFIDIFCESGYFTVDELNTVLSAGKKHGLRAKVHVNQFNAIGGVAAAVAHDALSVDHLERLTEEDIIALKAGTTISVALPGCSFFLNIPYTPARRIIDAGLPLAIASDYNPGSAPSGNMNFIVSQACINLKMTPEEAIIAATINGAFAMDIASETGSITKNKKANLIMTKPLKSYKAIPYRFGQHQIAQLIINGEFV
ncbi:MAG: imidazolonepropionase [Dokdonia sp.]|nr:imidazolonepropionase [Dokdonia sp.]